MTSKQLRKKYLSFFKKNGHAVIPGFSLIPEHDPTVLFTTAGMHPLVPFLLGEKHAQGTRLVDVQKCIRTGDIEQVGDSWHLTFFEMLGNWSLGDYWKKEAIEWSFEFLTGKKWLAIPLEKISVTVFSGDQNASRDQESAEIWQRLGIPKERIYFLPKEDNWWGPAGQTGPCGPCTEMFYDIGKEKCGANCRPGCGCGKYSEIWNDVFMEFNKTKEGGYLPLKQKNVDTGMGIERTIAVLYGFNNVFETELFQPIIKEIKSLFQKTNGMDEKALRIISDHIKAATFILSESIEPSNVEQGYVLRRLIRRSVIYGKRLGIENVFCHKISKIVIKIYKDAYPELQKNQDFI
ncbi:MAG: alanine--tRNA ligase, partial [bacterium]|nr:alanine--tRNA ligase [bacterium]